MAKKFDLYEELQNLGFTAETDRYGRDCLKRHFEKNVEVVWHGTVRSTFDITAVFNRDHEVVTVNYSKDVRDPFKTKVHFNQKRALNAIRETAKNNGFEF